jgi:NADH-quinone oxidoreductase subunit C
MPSHEIVAQLQQRFGSAVRESARESLDQIVTIDVEQLIAICTQLHDEHSFDLLNNISGVDYCETDAKKVSKAGFDPHIELVYHLSNIRNPGVRFALKVQFPRWQGDVVGELPRIASVSHIWRTADWHEREVYDLVGVRFLGHPDLRRILTADDWVGHPLRKDYEFPLEYHDIRCR